MEAMLSSGAASRLPSVLKASMTRCLAAPKFHLELMQAGELPHGCDPDACGQKLWAGYEDARKMYMWDMILGVGRPGDQAKEATDCTELMRPENIMKRLSTAHRSVLEWWVAAPMGDVLPQLSKHQVRRAFNEQCVLSMQRQRPARALSGASPNAQGTDVARCYDPGVLHNFSNSWLRRVRGPPLRLIGPAVLHARSLHPFVR